MARDFLRVYQQALPIVATLIALVSALTVTDASLADDGPFSVKGSLNIYSKAARNIATDLVPDPSVSGYQDGKAGVDVLLRPRFEIDRLKLVGQFRSSSINGPEYHLLSVDEAYAEMKFGESAFVYAGRRNLVYGHAYGLNPSDIFRTPLRENSVYPSTQARSMVEGIDMLGADLLLGVGTISALYVPDTGQRDNGAGFPMLRFSGVGVDGNLDYAVSAFGGDRPGGGLSVSYGMGESSLFYLDSTFRHERRTRSIASTTPVGALLLDLPGNAGIFPNVTIGYAYTFADGTSINLEYTHDEAGYAAREWHQMQRALDSITPVESLIAGSSLGQINALLNRYTLRQDYAFARIASPNLLQSKFDAELNSLIGLADGSANLGFRLEYPLTDQTTLGAYVSTNIGPAGSEFTLRPEKSAGALYAVVKF